ncbi:MAG: hypothetical protein ACRDYZ_03520 [Acidimicrobiales bacterium]
MKLLTTRHTEGGMRLASGGLAGNIEIPKPRAQTTLDTIGKDERWGHLRRLLTDEDLPLEARAAGALVLLYGLPVSRISELRADDVVHRDDRTYLDLGAHPLLLPPAVEPRPTFSRLR